MKALLITAIVVAAWLAAVWAAVAGGYDRGFLVPTPDAAAESFTRQITTGRTALALHALATPVARVETPETLRVRFAPLFSRTGKVNTVEAEQLSMQQDHALARVHVVGDDGRVSFEVGLVRESYLWKIEKLPALR